MWSGIIDDFQFYNKSLSEEEVKKLFGNNSIIENSLVGHWTFDGTIKDTSSNNNGGKMITIISSMVFAPDGRLFFSEKNTGNIMIMKNDSVVEAPFVTISDHLCQLGTRTARINH